DDLGIPSPEELSSQPHTAPSTVAASGAVHLSDTDMAELGYATATEARGDSSASATGESGEEAMPSGPATAARLRNSRMPIPRLGIKEIASIAAGLVFTFATFFFLMSNRGQQVEEVSLSTPTTDVEKPAADAEKTIHEAQGAAEEGQHQAAASQVAQAGQTGAASPSYREAKTLEIENAYKALPKDAPESEVDRLQSMIDAHIASEPANPDAAQLLRWKAELYERIEQPVAAVDTYKQALDDYGSAPRQDETLMALGRLYMKLGRPEPAVGVLQQLLDRFPGSSMLSDARLLQGDAQHALAKRDEARRLYTQVAVGEPNSLNGSIAYGKLGSMEIEDGRFGEAIKLLEARLEMATSTEGHEHIYLVLAKAYRGDGKLKEAEDTLRELIDFFPDSELTPQAYVELSQILEQSGRRPEAVRVASYAKGRFPGNAELLRNYSTMQSLSGDEAAAAEGLTEGLRAGSNSSDYLLATAQSLAKIGELEDTKKVLTELISTYPSSTEAFDGQIMLADMLYKNGEATEALENLDEMEQVHARKPQRLPIFLARGTIYRDLGLIERAAEDYEKAAALTKESAVLAECADVLFQANKLGSGLAAAERVDPAQLPEDAAYRFLTNYGTALMNGDADGAVEMLEKAANSYPKQRTREGDQALLKAYLGSGREASARVLVSNIQSQTQKDRAKLPELQEAALILGDHLFKKGDYRAAADTYTLVDDPRVLEPTDDTSWAKFQRANALLMANEPKRSLVLFKEVGAVDSRYSEDAKLKAAYIEASLKLRVPISLTSGPQETSSLPKSSSTASAPETPQSPMTQTPSIDPATTAAGG
ncbi:MAG: tetratricopeptide repeat protein, partial [Candidatus Hydrogenedentales bacterium]